MKAEDKDTMEIEKNRTVRTGSAIGLIIAKRRRELNLTQEKLAERAGISRQSICNIEQGKQKPSGQTLLRICETLSINCEALSDKKNDEDRQVDSRILALEKQVNTLSNEEQNCFFEIASIVFYGISRGEKNR